ncbi:Ig-like domain repeat protein [Pelomonas sp. BJYL3]|uniref:Ig-like domain repeat protein n=1 Tax=Pelomonas sp. BJYL3 TaxID=2976697 RepID=UPI0022B43860|nr:Ig-like domain repeat protein [Pelomonas sp. BJYL3]
MRVASQLKQALLSLCMLGASLLWAPVAQAQAPKISLSVAKTTAYVGEDLVFTLRFAARERYELDYHVSFIPGARCVSGGATQYVAGEVIHSLACSFSKPGPRAVQGIGGFLNVAAGGSVDANGNIRFGDWVPGSLSDPLDIVILPQIKPVLTLERLDEKVQAGQPVRLRARLSGVDPAVPVMGKVSFGASQDYALDAAGEAVGELPGRYMGASEVVARLNVASPAYEKVQSAPLSLVVEKSGSTTLLNAKATTLHGKDLLVLSGQVKGFSPGGRVTLSAGARVLDSVPLDSNGLFSYSTRLAVGSYSVVAQFPGDINNEASSSAPVAVSVDNATPASLGLSSTLKELPAGARTVLVASVGGNKPSGTVSFYEGTTLLGTAPVVEGMATLIVSFGTPGAHLVRAEYSGDANNIGLVSAGTVDFNVSTAPAPGSSSAERSYRYDRVGNVVGSADRRGNGMQAIYDARDRLSLVVNPVGGISRNRYNGLGQPISTTDADGVSETNEFDNFQRLTRQVDGRGNVTELRYELSNGQPGSMGAPTETRYPTYTQRQRLDALERPTADTLLNPTPLGEEGLVSYSTYDLRGRLKTSTDANGKTTSYSYDALGRLTELMDSLGNKTISRYSAWGDLLALTDPNGRTNAFEYDRLGRVTKETLPMGQSVQYRYDAAGNTTGRTDPKGVESEYRYDARSRVVEVQHFDSAHALKRKITLDWDAEDNLVAWTDTDLTRPAGQQESRGSAVYDEDNRKLSETLQVPNPAGGSYALSYSYRYSPEGRKTRLNWPDGSVVEYAYAAHGELERVGVPGEGSLSVTEFQWTAPTKVTLPGGGSHESRYDGLLNLLGQTVKTPTQQTVLETAYTYGKLQELKTRQRTDIAEGASSTDDLTLSYDDEARLVQAERSGAYGNEVERFTLDGAGNRVGHSRVSGAWTYDGNNRLLSRGTGASATTYAYDEAGNQVRKTEPGGKVTEYRYDVLNRLTEVRTGAGALVARYGYDPLDQRIWKEQYRDAAGQLLAQALRSYYLYGDEGLLAESRQPITLGPDEQVAASGAPVLHTQIGVMPDSHFSTAPLFVKTQNSAGQAVVAYLQHDQLGTPMQALDKNGRLLWSAQFNVFGRAQITTPAATAERPTIELALRLPGQWEDAETGLHYNFRRYYDPETGRYITQDPIGLEGGGNMYRYAEADPANLTDPTGEIVPFVGAAAEAAAIYGECVLGCTAEEAMTDAVTGECVDLKSSLKDCAKSCIVGPLGKLAKKLLKWMPDWARKKAKEAWDKVKCATGRNSFPGDTLVHVRPADAADADAQRGYSVLKPIRDVRVGDEVLAFAEWEEAGDLSTGRDRRLRYERVIDVFSSIKSQELVSLAGASGETIEATGGHPFLTKNGWKDAARLTTQDDILTRPGDWRALIDLQRFDAGIAPVFNIELGTAHAYFVGIQAFIVHNAIVCTQKIPRDELKPPKKRGNAPIGSDGHPVELHHTGPNTVEELTRTEHRGAGNFKDKHPEWINPDRKEFDKDRKKYWKEEWDKWWR